MTPEERSSKELEFLDGLHELPKISEDGKSTLTALRTLLATEAQSLFVKNQKVLLGRSDPRTSTEYEKYIYWNPENGLIVDGGGFCPFGINKFKNAEDAVEACCKISLYFVIHERMVK